MPIYGYIYQPCDGLFHAHPYQQPQGGYMNKLRYLPSIALALASLAAFGALIHAAPALMRLAVIP